MTPYFPDLDPNSASRERQAALQEGVQDAFNALLKEGYTWEEVLGAFEYWTDLGAHEEEKK